MANNLLLKEQMKKLEDKIQKLKLESTTSYQNIQKQILELELLLKECKIAEEEKNYKINIGSTFTAALDFGDEVITDTYTLVISRDGLKGNYVSVDSPFGSSVYGKEITDDFEYHLNGNMLVRGTIVGVDEMNYTEKLESEYVRLLKIREESNNMSENELTLLNLKISCYESQLKEKSKTKNLVK